MPQHEARDNNEDFSEVRFTAPSGLRQMRAGKQERVRSRFFYDPSAAAAAYLAILE